jgi:hypothetical protein
MNATREVGIKKEDGKQKVRRKNGATGMSDIEGKAVQGSSERVWATNEFQL